VRVTLPRADALGHNTPPLTGLRHSVGVPHDLCHESLGQETSVL